MLLLYLLLCIVQLLLFNIGIVIMRVMCLGRVIMCVIGIVVIAL